MSARVVVMGAGMGGLTSSESPCPMRVALAPEYLPAYARLPREAQRGADDLVRKLAADPRQPSIRYEAVPEARDPHLRLAPLDSGHAAVIWAPDDDSVVLLVWKSARSTRRPRWRRPDE